jgi:hypothetical protein
MAAALSYRLVLSLFPSAVFDAATMAFVTALFHGSGATPPLESLDGEMADGRAAGPRVRRSADDPGAPAAALISLGVNRQRGPWRGRRSPAGRARLTRPE